MKKALQLSKLQGTGNSFLFVDLRTNVKLLNFNKTVKSRSRLAQKLCHPHFGVGADGLVILESSGRSVSWDFYNSDGSSAEMCGNAARCVGLFISRGKPRKLTLLTKAGKVGVEFNSPKDIRIEMPSTLEERWQQTLTIDDQSVSYDFINTGVPHAVIQTPALDLSADNRNLAHRVQVHRKFKPFETNVTFYSVLGLRHIESASFERGVRDFTLACGTGAVAAARSYIRSKQDAGTSQVKVDLPGGQVRVKFTKNKTYLIGPASWIADIKVNI